MDKHPEGGDAAQMAVPLDDVACGPPRQPGHVLGGLWRILELGRTTAFFHAAPVEDTISGGRAEVWLVPQLLLPSAEQLEGLRERATLLRHIRHDGLRRVFDSGIDGDVGWIVVEPLTGGVSIAECLSARQSASEADLAHLAGRLAAPLDAAHQAGLVHGFLRPSDVTILGERVVIDGVGLWSMLSRSAAAAVLRGEGRYLAPEVRAGEEPTPRADVYSVGVLLAELAVGALGEAALGADLRVRLLRSYPLLGHALDGALAVHPFERLATLRELANDLDDCCGTDERAPELTVVEKLSAKHAHARHEDEEGSDTGRFAPWPSPRQSLLGQMIAPLFAGGVAPSAVEFRPVAPPPLPLPAPEFGETPPTGTERDGGALPGLPMATGSRPPSDFANTEDSIMVPRASSSSDVAAALEVPLDEPFVLPTKLARGTGPHARYPGESGARSIAPLTASEAEATRKFATTAGELDAPPTQLAASQARVIAGSFADPAAAPRTAVVSGTRVVPWRHHVMVVAALSVLTGAASWAGTMIVVGGDGRASAAPRAAGWPNAAVDAASAASAPRPTAAARSRAAIAKAPPASAPVLPVPPAPVLPTPPAPIAKAPPVAAAAPATGCPADMTRVMAGPPSPYCIDRLESPGAGRAPRVNLTREEAAQACASRGRRLCTPKEWERACRGPKRASYPYGSSFKPDLCNVRARAAPGRPGLLATCESASGARDMSGNAAEWVTTGGPRGGSSAGTHDGRCSSPLPVPASGRATDLGFRCCL